MLTHNLYSNIKLRRAEIGMTQGELAKKVGYSDRSMIAKIEAGKIDIPQSKLIEIAEVLHISPKQLIGWEEVNPNADIIYKIEQLNDKNKALLNAYIQALLDTQE